MSVLASNIPSTVSSEEVSTFFSFCGDVKSIKSAGSGSYIVNFVNEKAVSTALLLDEADFKGSKINVKQYDEALPTYDDVEGKKDVSEKELTEKKSVTKTGDINYDDIDQEEKPKYAIMAQLLAQGYDIGDSVIDKSIKFDKEHGYSQKFKEFVLKLDKNSVQLQNPESTASKFLNDIKVSGDSYFKKLQLNKYFQKVSNHPVGTKIHDFYTTLINDAKDVHEEAKRLKTLKHEEETAAVVEEK